MSDIVIEKNVVLPKERNKNKYPYLEMEIGDSFFVENGKLSLICNLNYRMFKLHAKRYIARSEDTGVRVWRTE